MQPILTQRAKIFRSVVLDEEPDNLAGDSVGATGDKKGDAATVPLTTSVPKEPSKQKTGAS